MRRNPYDRARWWSVWLLASALVCLLTAGAFGQRVLVVTTEQQAPAQFGDPMYNGEYIVTDLVAAGMPFDVVTYGRFVNMELDDHDVIFVSGHTSPTSVALVAAKCQTALQEGRKVFINGDLPHLRFSTWGSLLEIQRYTLTLFNVNDGGIHPMSGTASVPAGIEKDPVISSIPLSYYWMNTFTFNAPPEMTIRYGLHTIGFLYPQGGAIDSWNDHGLHLLDYGKVANYLRHGNRPQIGFANDRVEGAPVVSMEIHFDLTSNIPAINAYETLCATRGVPMTALLVYNLLTPESITKWNNINPLINIGSHSRTHQWDWPPLDILYETSQAIADQKELIPATVNYFNFSGQQNPTRTQMEQLYATGTVFGARGFDARRCRLPSGGDMIVQGMPTCKLWFTNLSQSSTVPYCLSQTIPDDITLWHYDESFYDITRMLFEANLKYGMYTYGFIHDLQFDPYSNYYVRGVPLSNIITSTIDYLVSRGAKFVHTDDLILRLRDFVAGNMDCACNPDGSVTVTVTRPEAKANEIKIAFDGTNQPGVSGSSVASQHVVGNWLYVTLKPETSSTVLVSWGATPTAPPSPVVTAPTGYASNASEARWSPGSGSETIAEYQYAVGTISGGTDAQNWTSAGTSTSVVLSQVNLVQDQTYYVSVRARYSTGGWCQPGVSSAVTADLTPPQVPVVTDDGDVQLSTSHLQASWIASDAESGISEYQYAIGTAPGATDVRTWASTTATTIDVQGLSLTSGVTYYMSVRARNGANLLSEAGSSNGITVLAATTSIANARRLPDSTPVSLVNSAVTAVFPGEIYIESTDRAAGIKVLTSGSYSIGQTVTVSGVVSRNEVERLITDATVTVTGTASVSPLSMSNLAVGGSGDEVVPGPTGGTGTNNVGLLIRTTGYVTYSSSNTIYIDDGAHIDAGGGRVGIKVQLAVARRYSIGTGLRVTGISTLEKDGTIFRRLIRTRRSSDVSVLKG